MRKALWLTALAVTIAYLPVRAQLTSRERMQIQSEIRAQFASITKAAETVDPVPFSSMLSSSPDASLFFNGHAFSADSAKALVRAVYASLSHQNLQMQSPKILVLDRKHALLTAQGIFSSTDKSGVTSKPSDIVVSALWVREPAGWKYVHFHQSLVPRP
jgi:hypothetical protein